MKKTFAEIEKAAMKLQKDIDFEANIFKVYTEREQRDIRKRDNLVNELYILSDAVVDIECAPNITENTFRHIERLIEKRKAEIEQELLMIPSELEE